jgi:hypothetical protein
LRNKNKPFRLSVEPSDLFDTVGTQLVGGKKAFESTLIAPSLSSSSIEDVEGRR